MKNQYCLLIVDDDSNILEVLDARFCAAGFRVFKSTDGPSAIKILEEETIDLVISDIKMPNMSGIELFQEIQQRKPEMPVIFLTAYGSIPEAVSAVHSGALDYLTKPFNGKDLVEKVEGYFKQDTSQQIAQHNMEPDKHGFYWGNSSLMKELQEKVLRVSPSNANVLILGESGVGKECIAKLIHLHSGRHDGPYIVVDCGSTPPGILESELFGHTKGAFTNAIQDKQGLIEAADAGTLFLDEIGNISSEMQHRLLRFLEDRKIRRVGAVEEQQIDCRVIAATNSNLTEDIEAGNFRQDLYFRLRVVTFTIPPLRDRLEDIPGLIKLFTENYCKNNEHPPITVPQETLEWLQNYHWPGNVRELKNSLEAAIVLSQSHHLTPEDFQLETEHPSKTDNSSSNEAEFSLESSEKEAIIKALKQTKGVQKRAAELLNISRRSIHYKLKKYDITPSDYKV